jgi:hypothetical protein
MHERTLLFAWSSPFETAAETERGFGGAQHFSTDLVSDEEGAVVLSKVQRVLQAP